MRRQVEEEVAAASSWRPLGLGVGGSRGAGSLRVALTAKHREMRAQRWECIREL